ncbi:MAG: SMP-30/gluconolactonase/LRE family protein [Bauldia sp.]|nr:SMP-30/gluconolactonase/LRE family protein [Bauldia sp.]
MTTTNRRAIALAGVAAAALFAGPAFAQNAEIPIGEMVFPENIASTPDGALLIGSIAQSTIYRVAPGGTEAEVWISEGLGATVTGVYAEGDTAYICSNGAFGSGEATLKTFDLATAAETGSYALPAGSFCSDTAVGDDGTLYVTSLNFTGGPGALFQINTDGTVETLVSDVAYAGLDGIAFLGGTLYANDLMTGALYRVNLGEDPVTLTPLTLSEPLSGPDGMRTTEDGTGLLIAEAQGARVSLVTVDGDNATVTEIASGLAGGPTGVAQIGDTIYVVEGQFAAMQGGGETTPFVVKAFPLP